MKSLILLLLIPLIASAKIPELDTIFYGTLYHNGGDELFAGASGELVVQARLNGVLLSETPVAVGTSKYAIKIPMDDGQAPRLNGTARFGERITLAIRSTVLDVAEDATENGTLGLSIPTERGSALSLNLTVSTNMESPMAAFSAWAVQNLVEPEPLIDSDFDGANNIEEFEAGTDPNESSEKFRIISVDKLNGFNLVKFGPIRLSRVYTVWASDKLGAEDWLNVGQITPSTESDSFLFGHSPANADTRYFYRLEVNLAD